MKWSSIFYADGRLLRGFDEDDDLVIALVVHPTSPPIVERYSRERLGNGDVYLGSRCRMFSGDYFSQIIPKPKAVDEYPVDGDWSAQTKWLKNKARECLAQAKN